MPSVFIPHLCSHPDLEAKGGCRLCSVEIEGSSGAVPACETMAKDGMRLRISGPEAEKVRKMAMELILATHPADCTGLSQIWQMRTPVHVPVHGRQPERWRKKSRSTANDDSNPLISHLFTRCVRCGRCIRACQDLRGVKVLDILRQTQAYGWHSRGKVLKGSRVPLLRGLYSRSVPRVPSWTR